MERMKLSFRWYGADDKVTLEKIRQIPGMHTVVTAVYDVPPGEVWPESSIHDLKQQIEKNGLHFEVVESIPVHAIVLLLNDQSLFIDSYIKGKSVLSFSILNLAVLPKSLHCVPPHFY